MPDHKFYGQKKKKKIREKLGDGGEDGEGFPYFTQSSERRPH